MTNNGWSEKFLAWAKCKGCKKLLTGEGDQLGFNKIPTQDEYDLTVAGNFEQDKALVAVRQMNKLVYEDIPLSIDHKKNDGNVAFKFIKNCKRELDFPEGNNCLAWHRLVAKYEPHKEPSYLNLKNRFENSDLVSIDEDPDEWITELASL